MGRTLPDILLKGFPCSEVIRGINACNKFIDEHPGKFGQSELALYGSSIYKDNMPHILVYRTKARIVAKWIAPLGV